MGPPGLIIVISHLCIIRNGMAQVCKAESSHSPPRVDRQGLHKIRVHYLKIMILKNKFKIYNTLYMSIVINILFIYQGVGAGKGLGCVRGAGKWWWW